MAFKRPKARILERTTTAGNGPYALSGAVDGSYNAFSAFMSVGDTTHLTVVEPAVAFWTGIATYSAANQITLTTVEETKGAFGAGTKEIFAGTLAARSAFFDDIAGAIVTGGTSTAYTVASYRSYGSFAEMNAALIAFTPHVANGATVTLNVDGLGVQPLRLSPGVELQSNTLIAGTPYMATYKNADNTWYLHALGGNAYGVPLGAGMDFWLPTAPSSAFVFPIGQAISRTTYATLFAAMGTTFGAGDGSTTFNLPDKRGRASVASDASAGRITGAVFNFLTPGGTGGTESHALTAAQIPSITSANAAQAISVTSTVSNIIRIGLGGFGSTGVTGANVAFNTSPVSTGVTSSDNNAISVTSNNTSGNSHPNVQPSIVCNYILRVI